jgi:hypothetical protein
MKHFKLNQKVRVNPSNDNDNYDSFRNEVLIITHVAKDINDHPGYDDSVSPEYLYDLKTASGKDVHCSLYDYELIPA